MRRTLALALSLALSGCALLSPRAPVAPEAGPVRTVRALDRLVGAGQVQNSDKPTYTCSFLVASPTASVDLCALEAGATKWLRVRRVVITNVGSQTTAGLRSIQLIRTTAAGTGSTLTPPPLDPNDPAFSGVARSGNTGGNLGAAGTALYTIPILVPTAAVTQLPVVIDFCGAGMQAEKCPISTVGVGNGISLRDPGATGGANVAGYVEFTEE